MDSASPYNRHLACSPAVAAEDSVALVLHTGPRESANDFRLGSVCAGDFALKRLTDYQVLAFPALVSPPSVCWSRVTKAGWTCWHETQPEEGDRHVSGTKEVCLNEYLCETKVFTGP